MDRILCRLTRVPLEDRHSLDGRSSLDGRLSFQLPGNTGAGPLFFIGPRRARPIDGAGWQVTDGAALDRRPQVREVADDECGVCQRRSKSRTSSSMLEFEGILRLSELDRQELLKLLEDVAGEGGGSSPEEWGKLHRTEE